MSSIKLRWRRTGTSTYQQVPGTCISFACGAGCGESRCVKGSREAPSLSHRCSSIDYNTRSRLDYWCTCGLRQEAVSASSLCSCISLHSLTINSSILVPGTSIIQVRSVSTTEACTSIGTGSCTVQHHTWYLVPGTWYLVREKRWASVGPALLLVWVDTAQRVSIQNYRIALPWRHGHNPLRIRLISIKLVYEAYHRFATKKGREYGDVLVCALCSASLPTLPFVHNRFL